jgi:hypothetical protein
MEGGPPALAGTWPRCCAHAGPTCPRSATRPAPSLTVRASVPTRAGTARPRRRAPPGRAARAQQHSSATPCPRSAVRPAPSCPPVLGRARPRRRVRALPCLLEAAPPHPPVLVRAAVSALGHAACSTVPAHARPCRRARLGHAACSTVPARARPRRHACAPPCGLHAPPHLAALVHGTVPARACSICSLWWLRVRAFVLAMRSASVRF